VPPGVQEAGGQSLRVGVNVGEEREAHESNGAAPRRRGAAMRKATSCRRDNP
jgi:hypothetical protein